MGRDGSEAAGADPCDAGALGRRRGAASPGRRYAAASSSSPARTWSATAPCPASGTSSSGSKRWPISSAETQPVETGRREHDRVEPALAALPQARVDVPAQRLDRELRLEREELRAAAHRRRADPHPGRERRRRRRGRRGDPRAARKAATASPSTSVEVMSFAEWTATSMRPAEQRLLDLLHEDPALADLAERLRAVAVAGGRDRDEGDIELGIGGAERVGGELRLRQREPTPAAAEPKNHGRRARRGAAPRPRRGRRRRRRPPASSARWARGGACSRSAR